MRLKRKSRKSSKVSIMLMLVMLLQMILQPFGTLTYAAAPIDGFTLSKTADKSEVEVGEEFNYTIFYQVDSSVAVGKTIAIEDAVPPQFQVITPPPGWSKDAAAPQTYRTEVTLDSGTSVAVQIRVKALPTGSASSVATVNNVIAKDKNDPGRISESSAAVTIKADPNPSTPTPTPAPTATQATYDKWETFKTQDTGFGSSVPIIGGEVIYSVGIRGIAGNTNTGSLNNVTLTDQLPNPLPAGTTVDFINAVSPNGSARVYDPVTQTITWTIPSIGSGQTFKDRIKVKFPDYYGYAVNNPVDQTNTVTLSTYGSIDGSGAIGGNNSSVTVKFGPPVAGTPNLTKTREYDYRYPGQTQKFTIKGIANSITNANSALSDLVLTDTLPPEMDYTSIDIPATWKTFEYRTSADPLAWKPISGLTAGTAKTISVGTAAGKNIVLAPGEYLTELKWTFDELNANTHISDINVEGIVRTAVNGSGNPVVHGSTVTNAVYLSYSRLDSVNPGATVPGTPLTASASFKINNPKPWLTVNKSYDTSMTYGPLNIVPFTLTIGNDKRATGPYVNPVIYDVLPAEFDYYTNPKIANITDAREQSFKLEGAPAGLPKPKFDVLSSTINGRTVVKWYWDEPVQIAPDTSFKITYQAKVKAGTEQSGSGYTNDVYITTADQNKEFWYNGDPDWPNKQDAPEDLARWRNDHAGIRNDDLPSSSNNAYYVHGSVNIPIVKVALVQSTKWNRGDLEPVFVANDNPSYVGAPAVSERPFQSEGTPEYTEFPRYSVTYEGGTADYKLVIRNSGNTRLGKIDVLDILPYVGDSAVRVSGTSLVPRGSEWRPNLAEVLPSGNKTFTSSAETGSKTVTYRLNAYYSKSADQDAVVNFSNARNARNGWTAQTNYKSDDLSDIKSLYFEINNVTGSDGQPGLKAGDYIVLDWKMDAPVGAPVNKIAWNSFAIQAQEVNDGLLMLPTAPNKVGFIIDPDSVHVPLGEIGDFVWFDSDGDGRQNERFDQDSQKSGINGITVNLYKDGEPTPYKTSKTGYDMSGNPGYYLFQGLEAGGYYVEFVLPDQYLPTIPNANGDDPLHSNNNDSNYTVKGTATGGYTPYRTDKIVLAAGGKNRTIDFGLIETAKPDAYPSASMVKSITEVTKGSSQAAPSQDYAVVGNQVKYSVVFRNTSTVTLHNIKITDQLDRSQSGFVYTKLIYDDQEIALNGSSNTRPDIISQILNTGGLPYVVVKNLDPGKSMKLEGEYSVTSDDIDGTDLKNTATAYYNEETEPLHSDTAIPTAGLEVAKTGSALSVSEAGTKIDYTIAVTNKGSRELHNVVLSDTKVSGIPVIALLKAGETKVVTYTYTVVFSDLSLSKLINTVKAKPDETPEGTESHEIPVVTSPRGSIGDYVWLDKNEDGVQGDSEQGINGIAVKLYDSLTGSPLAQTVTRSKDGKDGYYLFQGLTAGTYYVQFDIPADYGVTRPEAATSATDSNKTNAQGFTEAVVIGPSQWNDLTIDLGLVPRGEIGNYVWLDSNRDGLQNDGEPQGINGIEVRLFKGSPTGDPVAVAVTANDVNGKPGYYLFDNLLAGDYYVQFVIPSDYEKTKAESGTDRALDSHALNSEGFTGKITVGENQWVDHTIDLGLIPKGFIGNYVWFDSNKNGKQDASESGLNGVTVKLFDKNKELLKQTVTANDSNGKPGYYLFNNLTGGDYYVQFTVPAGYMMTQAEASGVAADADSNKLTDGYTSVVTIGEAKGWEDLTIDLGLVNVPVYWPIPTPTPTDGKDPVVPGATPKPSTPANPGTKPTPGATANPEIPIDNETTPKDTPKSGSVSVPDGGKPEVGKPPHNGTVTVDDGGKWVYTPEPDYTGKDSFSIIVTDQDGNEEEYMFDVDVEDVPLGGVDGPQAQAPIAGTLPITGEESNLKWELTGLGLIFLGTAMRKKRRRRL